MHGVVPVILAEGIVEPYERVIDWASFSVHLRDRDVGPARPARCSS